MDASQHPPLRALILAGGQSSRMGFPKYLLPMPMDRSSLTISRSQSLSLSEPQSRPLLIHLLDVLDRFNQSQPLDHHLHARVESVTVSVRSEAQGVEIRQLLNGDDDDDAGRLPDGLDVDFVIDAVADAGPAQGLLAAYLVDRVAHWLVLGCDYPLFDGGAVAELVRGHRVSRPAVTCFRNGDGFAEPLVAVWTPSALSVLEALVGQGVPAVGPSRVIRSLERMGSGQMHGGGRRQDYHDGVEFVHAGNEDWIQSVDTPEQWEAVQAMLRFSV